MLFPFFPFPLSPDHGAAGDNRVKVGISRFLRHAPSFREGGLAFPGAVIPTYVDPYLFLFPLPLGGRNHLFPFPSFRGVGIDSEGCSRIFFILALIPPRRSLQLSPSPFPSDRCDMIPYQDPGFFFLRQVRRVIFPFPFFLPVSLAFGTRPCFKIRHGRSSFSPPPLPFLPR